MPRGSSANLSDQALVLKTVKCHPLANIRWPSLTMRRLCPRPHIGIQKCMAGIDTIYINASIGKVRSPQKWLSWVLLAGAAVDLASHLPWLLHLLLLTGVGSASMSVEASSARTAEASHEASENLSATTAVPRSVSPGAAGIGARPPQGLSGRSPSGKHGSNCTSLASSRLSNRIQVSKAASLAFLF